MPLVCTPSTPPPPPFPHPPSLSPSSHHHHLDFTQVSKSVHADPTPEAVGLLLGGRRAASTGPVSHGEGEEEVEVEVHQELGGRARGGAT